ncbi:MAG: DMT family transporter [Desulfobacteraceae bacterium]
MNSTVWVILVAAIGGAAISIQAQMLSLIDRGLGTLESVFITYSGGALLIGLAMLVSGGGKLGAISTVPWYSLLSGAVGLIIVGTIGYSAQRLGLVAAFTIIVASQFMTGVLIDQFGLLGAHMHPINISRLAGIVLTLSGVWLILR